MTTKDTTNNTDTKVGEPKPTPNADHKWYVVHTYSGSEAKAKIALQERIDKLGMAHLISEIYVPTAQIEKLTDSGKKKTRSKTLYPGYILVKMLYSIETRHLVNGTPKISGFVGNNRNPRPISEREALRLTSQELGEEKVINEVKVMYEKGETVKIKEGAFANFSGTIDEVRPEKTKLRVLVSIFGRETPVEIDFDQAEKLT